MTQMSDLQTRINKISLDHGWWDNLAAFESIDEMATVWLSKLMLADTELAEAAEEVREGRLATWYLPDDHPTHPGKPEGAVVEMADTVIRLFDTAEMMGQSLEEAILIKVAYNEHRPYRHGGKLA